MELSERANLHKGVEDPITVNSVVVPQQVDPLPNVEAMTAVAETEAECA
jgi:hypothetical protein